MTTKNMAEYENIDNEETADDFELTPEEIEIVNKHANKRKYNALLKEIQKMKDNGIGKRTDMCRHCQVNGTIKCLSTPCQYHDTYIVKILFSLIEKMEAS